MASTKTGPDARLSGNGGARWVRESAPSRAEASRSTLRSHRVMKNSIAKAGAIPDRDCHLVRKAIVTADGERDRNPDDRIVLLVGRGQGNGQCRSPRFTRLVDERQVVGPSPGSEHLGRPKPQWFGAHRRLMPYLGLGADGRPPTRAGGEQEDTVARRRQRKSPLKLTKRIRSPEPEEARRPS